VQDPKSTSEFETAIVVTLTFLRALADAADEAMADIQRAYGDAGSDKPRPTDELIDAVVERVNGIADDCRQLSTVLTGYGSLALDATDADPGDEPEDRSDDEASAPERVPDSEPDPDPVVFAPPAPPTPATLADSTAPPRAPKAAAGAPPDSDGPIHVSEGIRLLATQMSVAGASNGEISRRLLNDFGVENADRLVAQLFGPSVNIGGQRT
jgi:hypothetical protein